MHSLSWRMILSALAAPGPAGVSLENSGLAVRTQKHAESSIKYVAKWPLATILDASSHHSQVCIGFRHSRAS